MVYANRIEALQSILSTMPQIDIGDLGPDDQDVLKTAEEAIRHPVALASLRALVAWIEEVGKIPVGEVTQSSMLAAIESGAGLTEITACLDNGDNRELWSQIYSRLVHQGHASLQIEVDPDRLAEADIPERVVARAEALQRVLARSSA